MAALEIIALDEATPQLRAPGSADTYLAPRALAITPVSLTGSAATSSLSIAQTWNTTGTPTAFDLLVTDTASNAASRLFAFRNASFSVLELRKDGLLQGRGPSSGAFTIGSTTEFRPGSITIGFQIGAFSTGSSSGGGGFADNAVGSAPTVGWSNRGFALISSALLGWTSGVLGSSVDVQLARDASNTLALRNGTNAQAFNVYNTFTDASNYERGAFKWVSNVLEIGPERAGTGANRGALIRSPGANLKLQAGTAPWEVQLTTAGHFAPASNNNQNCGDPSNAWLNFYRTGFSEVTEMTAPAAPATNRVRIYAQDNGAGKTQLMALFATGAAQQIAIEP